MLTSSQSAPIAERSQLARPSTRSGHPPISPLSTLAATRSLLLDRCYFTPRLMRTCHAILAVPPLSPIARGAAALVLGQKHLRHDRWNATARQSSPRSGTWPGIRHTLLSCRLPSVSARRLCKQSEACCALRLHSASYWDVLALSEVSTRTRACQTSSALGYQLYVGYGALECDRTAVSNKRFQCTSSNCRC